MKKGNGTEHPKKAPNTGCKRERSQSSNVGTQERGRPGEPLTGENRGFVCHVDMFSGVDCGCGAGFIAAER
jgi:hypothetical protein